MSYRSKIKNGAACLAAPFTQIVFVTPTVFDAVSFACVRERLSTELQLLTFACEISIQVNKSN